MWASVVGIGDTAFNHSRSLFSLARSVGEYPKGEGVFARVPLPVICCQLPPPGFAVLPRPRAEGEKSCRFR